MKHPNLLLSGLLLATTAYAQPDDILQLMQDRGCLRCHQVDASPAEVTQETPRAPAWSDIAARYKSVKGAQQQLTATVMNGSTTDRNSHSPYMRHWDGKVSGEFMPTHRYAISEAEAARIVAWVLAIEPETRP